MHARVLECVFQDYKNGDFKIISFLAKRARGLMMRHAVRMRATEVQQLESFDAEGYALARDVSTYDRLVFRRIASN